MKMYSTEQLVTITSHTPAIVQETVNSEKTAELIASIGGNHKLHIDKIGLLADLNVQLLLGLIHPVDFLRELLGAGISEPEARQIMGEINEKIFKPLQQQMREQGPGGGEASQPAPAPAPARAPAPLAPSYMPPMPPWPTPQQPLQARQPVQPPPPPPPTAILPPLPAQVPHGTVPQFVAPPPMPSQHQGPIEAWQPSGQSYTPPPPPQPSIALPPASQGGAPRPAAVPYYQPAAQAGQGGGAPLPPRTVMPGANAPRFIKPMPGPSWGGVDSVPPPPAAGSSLAGQPTPMPAPVAPQQAAPMPPQSGRGAPPPNLPTHSVPAAAPPAPTLPGPAQPASAAQPEHGDFNQLPPLAKARPGGRDPQAPHTDYSSDPYREPLA